MSTVVVTGGAGFIGSHCCVSLIEAGYSIVVLDNYSNASAKSIEVVESLTGKKVELIECDMRNAEALNAFFDSRKGKLHSVLHMAALKSVGESNSKPLDYYENNVVGTINLCRAMARADCKRIVFSSSATVYGNPEKVPLDEDSSLGCLNPYGRTKLVVEDILRDLAKSDPSWSVINLRYFNPAGAHPSGRMGEDPNGIPNNLMPYVSKVAVGKLEKLTVFGNDYKTHDGTGVRDYIHVCDLARGHVAAITKLPDIQGEEVVNLGTGRGYSVLDIVKAYGKACGKDIPYAFGPRREGDAAECFAETSKAMRLLGWKAELGLDDMCADAWRWQSTHPDGFKEG
uniref:UDP-glucose 4-epimerase n=1 Tax=Hemiselmis andersenii TaxID=464988 RepID=A0A6U4Q0N1_HEMAN|mmetsp:Transcript_15/g.42  ORF Transcript_15/g.42 Transcript_15/m.42 type:complete len:342 (+) Transcript_15:53-1078(+)